MMTTYHCLQGAANAEANLMLASIVTVPFNGFHGTKKRRHKIMLTVPGHSNNLCGLFVDCQEQQQQRCLIRVDCIERHHQKDYSVVNL